MRVKRQQGWQGNGFRLFGSLGAAWRPSGSRRFTGREKQCGGHRDAEHVAERAQDSAGLRGCGEEFGHVGAGQEVLELAGAAADMVVGGAGEPGAAGGKMGLCRGWGFACGAGLARGGQGVGLPAGKEGLETSGGATDAVGGDQENRRTGGVMVDMGGEGGAQAAQDRREEGFQCFHS